MVNSADVGKRLLRFLLEDGVWAALGTRNGIVYSFGGSPVPPWLVQAIELAPRSDVVRKRLLSHGQRFAFVYAALDYGITPGRLQDWIVDGPWSESMKADLHGLIGKYLKQSVRLKDFRERRKSGPFYVEEDIPMPRRAPVARVRPPVWDWSDDYISPEDLAGLDRVERAIRNRPAIEAQIAEEAHLRRQAMLAPLQKARRNRTLKLLQNLVVQHTRKDTPYFDDSPEFVEALASMPIPLALPAPYSDDEEEVPIRRTRDTLPDVIPAPDVKSAPSRPGKRISHRNSDSDDDYEFISERGAARVKYQDKRQRLE